MKPRTGLVLFALCSACSGTCGAPKPTPEDDPVDRDAAPHALEAKPRCDSQAKIALPGALELGRARVTGSRVIVGARRGNRAGVLDTDGVTARFTEVADATGDMPPPLALVSGVRPLALTGMIVTLSEPSLRAASGCVPLAGKRVCEASPLPAAPQ